VGSTSSAARSDIVAADNSNLVIPTGVEGPASGNPAT
jgi:hypothetical protein